MFWVVEINETLKFAGWKKLAWFFDVVYKSLEDRRCYKNGKVDKGWIQFIIKKNIENCEVQDLLLKLISN